MKSLCLENDIFIRCITGKLSENEKARTIKHLSECDNCLEEFTLTKTLLYDKESAHWEPVLPKQCSPVLTGLSEKFSRFCKWLDYNLLLEKSMFSEYAPVRSSHKSPFPQVIQFSKKKDNLKIFTQIEKTENNFVNIRIKVFEQEKIIKSGRLTLMSGDGTAMSRPVKEQGTVFENLDLGIYRLVIKQNNVVQDDFFIKTGRQGVEFKDDLS